MKKTNLFLSALACSALLGVQLSAQEAEKKAALASATATAPAKEAYKVGSTVDEKLTLTDIDGKTIAFKDLRDKVVLIHFWSTQCPYEKVADPKFTALEKRWKDKKDVVILAINANGTEIGPERHKDPKGYDAIRTHMKEKSLAFPVYADHGNVLADLFGAQSTPHCFVLDKKGVIVYAGGLDDDPKGEKGEATQQYARDAVEATLAGQPVTTKESKPYGCSIKRVRA